MKKSQHTIKPSERKHHTVDATERILGRLATVVVRLLRGKNKTSFKPNIDGGDFVTIDNIEKIKVSGKKAEQKIYYHYSGFPGGIKEPNYQKVFSKNPKAVLERAVLRMLPENRLRKNIMKRLIIK